MQEVYCIAVAPGVGPWSSVSGDAGTARSGVVNRVAECGGGGAPSPGDKTSFGAGRLDAGVSQVWKDELLVCGGGAGP